MFKTTTQITRSEMQCQTALQIEMLECSFAKMWFRSEPFQIAFWKLCKAVSPWRQLVYSRFLFHWSLLRKYQWDQNWHGLICFFWHWDQGWKWWFRTFQAFWNACWNIGFSMDFPLKKSKIGSLCCAHRLLHWALLIWCFIFVSNGENGVGRNSFLGWAHCWQERSRVF